MLAVLGGCDRQSGQNAQQAASSSLTDAASDKADEAQIGTFDRSHKGSHLPDLTFTDTDGHPLRLAALTGKPLLLNLWATWCAPCVAELPTLDALAGAKGAGLQVVAISQDLGEGDALSAKVKDFWQGKGFRHIHPALDPQGEAASQYQAATLPTTIYYDAQGREVWRLTGGHDWSGKDTDKLLAETAG
ncbi:MAG: TlpA family protein disulfide reductase [Sphingomonadales bacterium]|nr:TlpA family protein disulfide reductase [Sphingomonadales bacterium]MDE2169675.1 TlpA family protein disulfide reductase [Sphingomonadales bacterium]